MSKKKKLDNDKLCTYTKTSASSSYIDFPSIMIGNRSKSDVLIEKVQLFKAKKRNMKNELRQLRYDASKEFREKNNGWIRTLDIIGIILILLNFGALFITGMLVVRADPSKGFAEVNPTQCAWNGWSCHSDASQLFWPIVRQFFVWAILIGLYIYARNTTFNITGLWILTAMMILYTVIIGADFINDLGLYIGKIIWGI